MSETSGLSQRKLLGKVYDLAKLCGHTVTVKD